MLVCPETETYTEYGDRNTEHEETTTVYSMDILGQDVSPYQWTFNRPTLAFNYFLTKMENNRPISRDSD